MSEQRDNPHALPRDVLKTTQNPAAATYHELRHAIDYLRREVDSRSLLLARCENAMQRFDHAFPDDYRRTI